MWLLYGAESLVGDVDLEQIAQRASTIFTVNDLDSIAPLPHLDDSLLGCILAVAGVQLEGSRDTARGKTICRC